LARSSVEALATLAAICNALTSAIPATGAPLAPADPGATKDAPGKIDKSVDHRRAAPIPGQGPFTLCRLAPPAWSAGASRSTPTTSSSLSDGLSALR